MNLKTLAESCYERLLNTLAVAWIIVLDTAFVIGWIWFDHLAANFIKSHESHGYHDYIVQGFQLFVSGGIFLIAASHIAKDAANALISLTKEVAARWNEIGDPSEEDAA